MKEKDWQRAIQLVQERQSQVGTADTSKLSSFSLSGLTMDQSRPNSATGVFRNRRHQHETGGFYTRPRF